MRAFLPLVALLSMAATDGQPVTPKERATVIATIKANLKDPDSAQFKDIKHMGDDGFCGYVNAKNAFGGYTGYTMFVISSKGVSILPADVSQPGLC